jgi:hypothetical protein
MRNLTQYLIIISALSIVAFSCNDDDDASSKASVLTSKNWQLASSIINGVEAIEDCEKDNVLSFRANETYTYSYNTLCRFEDEAAEIGIWKLLQNETLLVLGEGTVTDAAVYEIIELTSSTLKLSLEEDDSGLYVHVLTYNAQ